MGSDVTRVRMMVIVWVLMDYYDRGQSSSCFVVKWARRVRMNGWGLGSRWPDFLLWFSVCLF